MSKKVKKFGLLIIAGLLLTLLSACAASLPTLSSGTPTPLVRMVEQELPESIKGDAEYNVSPAPTTTPLSFATLPPLTPNSNNNLAAINYMVTPPNSVKTTPAAAPFDGERVPIIGSSVVPLAAMRLFVAKRNPTAPLEVIDLYYSMEKYWNIRADVLICQMIHETGTLTSWWSQPPRRNLAGLGVSGEVSTSSKQGNAAWQPAEEGKWRKGYAFGDWSAAVAAHYAHMSAYVYTEEYNNASQLSPGYRGAVAYLRSLNKPPARYLTDLNGIWAVPGTDYGQRIGMTLREAINFAATIR